MSRRAFSLLEVMVALGILVVSLTILIETQSNAVQMTAESEQIIVATDLAVAKFNEANLRVESDGFQIGDIEERGDFSDFGDEATNLEFGQSLEKFKWEYSISEIDLDLAGDIATMASEMDTTGMFGAAGDAGGGDPAGGAMGNLGALMSGDAITQMLGPYIREVRVRVWWGDDSDDAEDRGDEVFITGHVVNPTGVLSLEQGAPPLGGGS
ncbi:MAG: prepilin-type N-terminal cleavage/methylation domain-containing protein [Myxococcota bacterium]|jgi:prepilin-type N-terminal cleavage/methylation domain-containing protein